MFRLPYSWRRKEGVKSGIPKLRALHYKFDCFFENLYIRLARLPEFGINTKEQRSEAIIVSLTSFPARINKTYYAVKSLMLQSVKADRIVLWLAEKQFPDKKIPEKIQLLMEKGMEIE